MSTQQAALTRVTQAYYAQAGALSLTATDFYHWLNSLPGTRWAEVLQEGFTTGQQPDFLRHFLERRSHRLSDFLAGQFSLPDFAQWVASGERHPAGPKRPA